MDENQLAVIVLFFLILSLIASLVLILKSTPIATGKSWYTAIIPVFALLGFPGILDLMKTGGLTGFFAVMVFIVLVSAVAFPVICFFLKNGEESYKRWFAWSIPMIVGGGLLVAGYLSYIEITAATPVCGVGMPGCVTVQSSQYARLFNLIPIGVIGVLGYLAIITTWVLGRICKPALKKFCLLAVWGMCFFGVLFSAYLTYLEPFVIHATCSWCITSAVLMILLLWIATPAGQQALLDDDE